MLLVHIISCLSVGFEHEIKAKDKKISANLANNFIEHILAKMCQKKNSTGKHDKGCAKLIGAGMQLKDDAAAFVESIKEDAEDIKAEAAYNKSEAAKA